MTIYIVRMHTNTARLTINISQSFMWKLFMLEIIKDVELCAPRWMCTCIYKRKLIMISVPDRSNGPALGPAFT